MRTSTYGPTSMPSKRELVLRPPLSSASGLPMISSVIIEAAARLMATMTGEGHIHDLVILDLELQRNLVAAERLLSWYVSVGSSR